MRTVATLFIAGLAGIAALKIVVPLMVPLLGMMLGLLALLVKAVLVVTLAWFAWSVVRDRRRGRAF